MIYIYIYIYIYVYMCKHINIYINLRMHVFYEPPRFIFCKCEACALHTRGHMCIYLHVYIYMYIYMYVCGDSMKSPCRFGTVPFLSLSTVT